MKPAGAMLATIVLGAAVVTSSATAGLAAHGGGHGGGEGGFGSGHFGGMPYVMHGGGLGGSDMSYGDHSGGYSHPYFYHGGRYRPYPYYPSYDDDDDSGYYYYNSYCARMHSNYDPYTGAYVGSDGRLHYCS
ncbi:hypothetical protein NKH95_01600 [Mesorhizobium sp. M0848]|uniref:hypothetical protein n=1 Tax=Mesorhizobium sp. M0848 TaxID=2957012 RepID=UPI00333DADAB